MPTRKRKIHMKPAQRSSSVLDIWGIDEILAPNSDTECEPLSRRRKQIEEIERHVRDGGELYLLSTSLRGPVLQNPWRRKVVAATVAIEENVVEQVSPVKKRRKVLNGRKNGGKEKKVDQYFNAQKNSQEREVVMKKKMTPEKYTVGKEDPIFCDNEEMLCLDGANIGLEMGYDGYEDRENSVEPLKAVPRLINFDQIPPSTDIGTQNYPSLHLIPPRRQPARALQSDHIDSASAESKENKAAEDGKADDDGGLFDDPTPEKTIVPKLMVQEPTTRDLESIRNLLGDEQPQDTVPPPIPDDERLYDPPTPPPNLSPARNSSSLDSILPASLTLRYTRFSPIKSMQSSHLPTSTTPLSPSKNLNRSPSPRKSPQKLPFRRSSSLQSPPNLHPSAQLQRTQSANAACTTPPLNTQHMLDLANQSFNAILPTPSPSLLPAAEFGPANTSNPLKAALPSGFTPFKDLRSSPTLSDRRSGGEGVSFKLADSPLTYSPMMEDALLGEFKFLGAWSLEDELEKMKKKDNPAQEGQEDSGRESQGKSQECAVGA